MSCLKELLQSHDSFMHRIEKREKVLKNVTYSFGVDGHFDYTDKFGVDYQNVISFGANERYEYLHIFNVGSGITFRTAFKSEMYEWVQSIKRTVLRAVFRLGEELAKLEAGGELPIIETENPQINLTIQFYQKDHHLFFNIIGFTSTFKIKLQLKELPDLLNYVNFLIEKLSELEKCCSPLGE